MNLIIAIYFLTQALMTLSKWVYMGGVFAAALIHRISSHKSDSMTVKQYRNFIRLFSYYLPDSGYIDEYVFLTY